MRIHRCLAVLLPLQLSLFAPSAISTPQFISVAYPGAISTTALGINDQGYVVGQGDKGGDDDVTAFGFVFDGTSYIKIEFPGVSYISYAEDISNNGLIVGGIENEQSLRTGYLTDTNLSFLEIIN